MLGTLLFLSPLITPQIFAILCLLLPLSFLWTWNARFWCSILDNFCLWVCVVVGYMPSSPRMGLNTLQGELGPLLWEEAEGCWSPSPVPLSPLSCSLRCTSFLVCSELFLALPSAGPVCEAVPELLPSLVIFLLLWQEDDTLKEHRILTLSSFALSHLRVSS